MKLRLKTLLLFLLCITIMLMPYSSVDAAPPLPSSFYGTAKFNGENVREGTIIRTLINGRVVATTSAVIFQGESVYSIDVPGDDPATPEIEGGIEGDMIRFMLGGFLIRETVTWQSGTDIEFNLSLTANATLPPPQPTETFPPTPTPLSTQTPLPTATGTPLPTAITLPTQRPTIGQTPSFSATPINSPTVVETLIDTAAAFFEIEETEAPLPTVTEIISENETETQPEINQESRGMGFVLPTLILSGFGAIGAVVFWVIRKKRKEDSGLLL
jgi:hypothetical protein